MTSPGLAIKSAIAQLIADMNPAVVPTTTLAAAANPGDRSIQINPLLDSSGRSRILEGARLYFNDGLGEQTLPVSNVTPDGRTVTFDFAGRSPKGLQLTHANGTAVYTNLMPFVPNGAGKMLLLGDPVIGITVRRYRARRDGLGYGWPTYGVRLAYLRQYTRPEADSTGERIDEDVWAEEQENAAMADLEGIAAMLLQHQDLSTRFSGAAAEQFAALNSNQDLITIDYDWRPRQGDIWDYVALMDCLITGPVQTLNR